MFGLKWHLLETLVYMKSYIQIKATFIRNFSVHEIICLDKHDKQYGQISG